MVPISITNEDRILVIAPHPDDESIGCGGLLSKYSQQCEVWLLTDGRLAGEGDVRAIIETRKKEFEREMEFLGISRYRMFNVPDQQLCEADDLFQQEDLNVFSKIFVTNSKDNHPDHALAYSIIQKSLISKGVMLELYQYEVTTPFAKASHYLNISDCIDKKIEAISLNESQVEMVDYCQIGKSLSSYRAETMGIKGGFVEQYLLTDYSTDDVLGEKEIEALKEKERTSRMFACYNKLFALLEDEDSQSNMEKKVIVYGCGKFGKLLINILSGKHTYHVDFIIDNYVNFSDYRGIPVIRQSDVSVENYKNAMIVVAVLEGGDVIEKNLRKMGLRNVCLLADWLGC